LQFEYNVFEHDVLCVGKGGTGKTYLANIFFIPALKKANVPFVVYDPQRSFGTPFEHPDIVYDIEDIPVGGSAIYRPARRDVADFDRFCEKILHPAEGVEGGNIIVIVDEVHFFSSKHKIKSENFREIVNGGRPRGICWICLTRRPASVHNDILSDAELIFSFEQELPSDVVFMSKWIGIQAFLHLEPEQRDVISPKINLMLNHAPKLPPHHFILRQTDTGTVSIGKI
jgi:DNA helicase HerA-like ATPase